LSFYLGIDIGGTKSHALISDQTGRVLGFAAGSAGNHEAVGYPGLKKVLGDITAEALDAAGLTRSQIAGAGFGVAGYDWPSEREPTREAIETLKLSCPFEFVNDTVIGLIAGTSEGWGVSVVGGTGENCWGRDRNGRIGRMTGNGIMMGEYGGAGTIVAKAVQAIGKAWSLRGPATKLVPAFIEYTNTSSLIDLIERLGLGKIRLRPSAAPIVVQTAEQGDEVAKEILEWAGTELAELANGVIRQLNFEDKRCEVVMVGSMFTSTEILTEPFFNHVRHVCPGAEFVHLEAPPVIGSVLLGMEAAGIDAWTIRENMIATFHQTAS
jgi:N-acetylglucosamine kinase-like BadF-type ATPase